MPNGDTGEEDVGFPAPTPPAPPSPEEVSGELAPPVAPPPAAPAPADGGVAPPEAPPQPPTYDPRTPARARESGVPWLGLPPGVEAQAVPGGTPIITKAPPGYVPPPGYVLSKELIMAREQAKLPPPAEQKFGRLPPPPTPSEQAKWEATARKIGIDPFAYVQQQWMRQHNLSVADIVASGQELPGITMAVTVAGRSRIAPVPLPGTLAEPYDETKTHLKVYGERGQLVSVSRQALSTMQYQLSPPQRIQRMVKLGILPSDTKVFQFTAKQLEERGLTTAEAERAVEQGKNWGYFRKSDVEAQRLAVSERERALAQERITKEALTKLANFKSEVGVVDVGGAVYKGRDVYDLYGILDASKRDPAFEKAAIALFGVRYVAETKRAKTSWESKHTKLPDGQWMLNSDLAEIKESSPLAHKILTTKGYSAYKKANKEALIALRDYKVPPTEEQFAKGIIPEGYFVASAVAKGVDKKHLNLLFGRIIIEETEPESMIPSGFPSDADYIKLTLQQKNELGRRGDLRRKWGVTTWEAGQKAEEERGKGLMTKPLYEITGEELQEIIASPFLGVSKAVRDIGEPFRYPWANKLLTGVAHGTGDAIIGTAMFPVIVGGLTGIGLRDPSAASMATWQVGSGMFSWGKHTVTQVWKDPTYGIPYAVITLGPMAYTGFKTVKWAGKKVVVWAHPKGVPMSLIGKEYSAGRIPIGKLDTADLGRAVGKAMEKSMETGLGPKGKASGIVTEGGITVQYLKTPYQMEVGNALWHGTSDIKFLETEAGFFTKLRKEAGKEVLAELHDANLPAVRKFSLADAKNVPRKVAKPLTDLIKRDNARVYGSFTEWLHNRWADRPADFDIAVRSPAKTVSEIIQICKDKGIPARKVTHGVEIERAGEWVKLCDVVSLAEHNKLRPLGYKAKEPIVVDGVRVERIGEQLARRGASLVKSGAKGRLKDLRQFKITLFQLRKRIDPALSRRASQFTENIEIVFRAKGKGAGEPGLYLSPYAAEYFAQGKDPGLILVLTDTAKLKEVPTEALGRVSQSDWYISGAKKGLHEPSKAYKGAYETEIVASPETALTAMYKKIYKVSVKKLDLMMSLREGELFNRLFMGLEGDLFTMNREGKYLPVRIAYDKGVMKTPPTASELYAVKLHIIRNSLENFKEAIAHPGRALKDIVRGRPGPKGLREVEVTNVDLQAARGFEAIRTRLELEAKRATDHRVKGKNIPENSPKYNKLFQEELKRAFDREGKRLKREYGKQIEEAYRQHPERFEDIYRYHLERTFRAFIRYRIITKGARGMIAKARERQRAEVVRSLQAIQRTPETRRTLEQRREITRLREVERRLTAIITPRISRETVRARATRPVAREAERIIPEREVVPREEPVREPRRVPRREPRRVPPPPPPPPPSIQRIRIVEGKAKLPDGSIAFRQGIFWKYLPPPWNQSKLITLRRGVVPMGAVRTHLRTPQETVQKIGDPLGEVPFSMSADLGPFDLEITNYGENIEYVAGGLATDVGAREPSPTKGLSIPSKGISRPDMTTEAPPRKETETTIQGISRPEVVEARDEVDTDLYVDETEEFWGRFNSETRRPINRPKMSKKASRRKSRRDNPPMTQVRGVRL